MDCFTHKDVDVYLGKNYSDAELKTLSTIKLLREFAYMTCFHGVQIMQSTHGCVQGLGTVVNAFYTMPLLENGTNINFIAATINPLWDESCLDKYDVTTCKVERSLIVSPPDRSKEIDKVLFIPKCEILTVATKETIRYFFDFKTMPDGKYAYMISLKKLETIKAICHDV